MCKRNILFFLCFLCLAYFSLASLSAQEEVKQIPLQSLSTDELINELLQNSQQLNDSMTEQWQTFLHIEAASRLISTFQSKQETLEPALQEQSKTIETDTNAVQTSLNETSQSLQNSNVAAEKVITQANSSHTWKVLFFVCLPFVAYTVAHATGIVK